ncbi:hypothetical protein [Bilophila wadsworthia]|uniref:hypothetical protein n=1 Tax=Bilophila wadsworthia TaxID=35833 RepID=UPI002673E116|nr:hypothetical protein [Bilophila wadsworthia]
MTAQEWLDELERLRKAATPGPWICKEGEGFDEDDACITAEEREGMIDIAKIERGSPNAGMDEPFQSEQTANAAYIVAACNAVPRMVEMLRIAVSLIEAQNAQRARKGEKMPEGDVMQLIFTLTEPKE